jgi:hypothetical protein
MTATPIKFMLRVSGGERFVTQSVTVARRFADEIMGRAGLTAGPLIRRI